MKHPGRYFSIAIVAAAMAAIVAMVVPQPLHAIVVGVAFGAAMLIGLFVGAASTSWKEEILQVWSDLKKDIRWTSQYLGQLFSHQEMVNQELLNRLDSIQKTIEEPTETIDEELRRYIEQLEAMDCIEDIDRPYHGLLGLTSSAIAHLCSTMVDGHEGHCKCCGRTDLTLKEHPFLAVVHEPTCPVPTAIQLVNEIDEKCLKQRQLST